MMTEHVTDVAFDDALIEDETRRMAMKKIVLLTTGGTIASKPNQETGLLTSGAFTGEELATMCELPEGIDVVIESVFQIPSNQMTFDKWVVLKQKIEQAAADQDVDGIVVTQGTDTLEETAYFLDLTVASDKPLVITGSQRGPTELGSDAFTNIRQAILVACEEQCRGMGCLVLFNERIFSARYVQKVHASNVAGFSVHGFGYLGIVDRDQVYIYQKPVQRDVYTIGETIPPVDIIKFYAGGHGKFAQCAWENGAKGLILEGAGRGHVPPGAVDDIEDVIEKGMTVVLTTSAEEGEVYPVYDFVGSVHDLQNRGVIIGKDYDSKKARIRLAVQLSAGVKIHF